MDERMRRLAEETSGFMPPEEGIALHRAGLQAPAGRWVEIGSYCGKSTVYLGTAARLRDSLLITIDHHRGSEEHQPGEQYHDPALTDGAGRVDTLPELARTLSRSELWDVVLPLAGRSSELATAVKTDLSLVFIDGGHSREAAVADFSAWAPKLIPGGSLLIHDVFPDPEEGGRPPYEIYRMAIDSGRFAEVAATGSLRCLVRLTP